MKVRETKEGVVTLASACTSRHDWHEGKPGSSTFSDAHTRLGSVRPRSQKPFGHKYFHGDFAWRPHASWPCTQSGKVSIVRRTWGLREAVGDARFNTPKNGKERKVDMSPQLAETLIPLLRQPLQQWLWLSGDGPLSPVRFHYRVWQPVMRASGLAYRKPHTLRHTYASLLLAQGVSMAYVKEQLGHHSIQVTVDIYGHLVPQSATHVDMLDTL